MISKVLSAMLYASSAKLVEVETDASPGLPGVEMTGNLGASVRDCKERIRVAIKKSGFAFPTGRVTINIAPASLRKEGTGFDLAVASSILVEMGQIEEERLREVIVIGELGLDGKIIGIRGVLPMILEAQKMGIRRCVVPPENYDEATIIEGMQVIAAYNLRELVKILNSGVSSYLTSGEKYTQDWEEESTEADIVDNSCDNIDGEGLIITDKDENIDNNQILEMSNKNGDKKSNEKDFDDIYGQEYAKRAVLAATAGMHNILLLGPPGVGKTMLASRIPTIMPDMTNEEWMDLTCLYSVAGKLENNTKGMKTRPFRAPHHSITSAALAGGGRYAEPGEISLATKGVLFLDELTKYNPQVIELLREPLESGRIMINRVTGAYEFPADFMLVTAINPCTCGFYPDRNKCSCTQIQIDRHYGRISKPILDRIDMSVQLRRLSYSEITRQEEITQNKAKAYEDVNKEKKNVNEENNKMTENDEENPISMYSSENMKKIVSRVWKIQQDRLGKGRFNSRMTPEEIDKYCVLDNRCKDIMRQAYESYDMSARAYHKTLKVARTLADIDGRENIGEENILEALGYRVKDRMTDSYINERMKRKNYGSR